MITKPFAINPDLVPSQSMVVEIKATLVLLT